MVRLSSFLVSLALIAATVLLSQNLATAQAQPNGIYSLLRMPPLPMPPPRTHFLYRGNANNIGELMGSDHAHYDQDTTALPINTTVVTTTTTTTTTTTPTTTTQPPRPVEARPPNPADAFLSELIQKQLASALSDGGKVPDPTSIATEVAAHQQLMMREQQARRLAANLGQFAAARGHPLGVPPPHHHGHPHAMQHPMMNHGHPGHHPRPDPRLMNQDPRLMNQDPRLMNPGMASIPGRMAQGLVDLHEARFGHPRHQHTIFGGPGAIDGIPLAPNPRARLRQEETRADEQITYLLPPRQGGLLAGGQGNFVGKDTYFPPPADPNMVQHDLAERLRDMDSIEMEQMNVNENKPPRQRNPQNFGQLENSGGGMESMQEQNVPPPQWAQSPSFMGGPKPSDGASFFSGMKLPPARPIMAPTITAGNAMAQMGGFGGGGLGSMMGGRSPQMMGLGGGGPGRPIIRPPLRAPPVMGGGFSFQSVGNAGQVSPVFRGDVYNPSGLSPPQWMQNFGKETTGGEDPDKSESEDPQNYATAMGAHPYSSNGFSMFADDAPSGGYSEGIGALSGFYLPPSQQNTETEPDPSNFWRRRKRR